MKQIAKIFTLLLAILLIGCNKNDDFKINNFKITAALSIFTNNGKVGITSLVNENYIIKTEYWINNAKTDAESLKAFMRPGNYYRTSIDNYHLASIVYKKNNGTIVEFKFPRLYSLAPDNQLIYFKDSERHAMDTLALGAIYSVDASDTELFVGFFAERRYTNAGAYLAPVNAFYWDGDKKKVELPMPENYLYFNGVSCIHKSGDDIYVSGLMDFPMYWKNNEIRRLSDKYGEVNQVITAKDNVYAVGFYNKYNSSSTGHTACYWKNDILTELEDNAIAYSISIDGDDIYVAGAVGRFDSEYKACYWKNGKRVMLPISQ